MKKIYKTLLYNSLRECFKNKLEKFIEFSIMIMGPKPPPHLENFFLLVF